MKTSLIAIALLLSFIFTTLVWAAEKPLAKLNTREAIKAIELNKKYLALTKNPETLEALKRLAEALKNK